MEYVPDAHLEAAYEDANGDPHGIGSPEWEEDWDDADYEPETVEWRDEYEDVDRMYEKEEKGFK